MINDTTQPVNLPTIVVNFTLVQSSFLLFTFLQNFTKYPGHQLVLEFKKNCTLKRWALANFTGDWNLVEELFAL